MSKLRKKLITVLTVLFCALLTLSAVLIIPKSTEANAATRSGSWTEIDEIYNNTDSRFDYDNLQKLYKVISDSSSATFDINSVATTITSKYGAVTSSDIRVFNNGNNVSVTFCGIKWDVTYITTVRNDTNATNSNGENIEGDIVIDLWMSSDSVTKRSAYANHEVDNTSTGIANINYPSNMYSTSEVRATALNAYGYASKSNAKLNTDVLPQTAKHDYARFTMANGSYSDGRVTDSVIDFIVQPKDIAYQEKENITEVSSSFSANGRCPNDAYGDVGKTVGTKEWYVKNVIYWGKGTNDYDTYDAWKNDYLWLPSITETGNNNTNIGIWETDQYLRSLDEEIWLRSGKFNANDKAYYIKSSGEHAYNMTQSTVNAVRPALHLNLTKANEDAKKIVFGTSKTVQSTVDGTEIALLEHTYNNTFAEIEIPDWKDRLEIGTPTNGSYYDPSNGKFTARDTTLKDRVYETGKYEITVQPKGIYYWADGSTDPRKYEIHIKPATLTVSNMANPYEGIAVSGSLLQSDYIINSSTLGTNITPKIKYNKVEPADYSSATRPPDNQFTEDDGSFTASSEGTYLIYYNVEVAHHTIFRGYYDVIVSGTDSAKLVYTGTAYTSDYGDTNAILLEDADELKAALQANMKVQKDGADDPTRFNSVWDKLEAVVCTKDGSNYKPAEKNGAGHYDVGTYYVDLKYKQGESQSIALSWDGELPKFEITPRSITIQVIADGDGKLSSIYGEDHAAMKFELLYGTLAEGEDLNGDEGKYKLPFGDFLVQVEEEEPVVLNTYTPVGIYKVTADISKIINYTVKIERQNYDYEVKARPVTLKVTDVSVVYGTDLSSYNFKLTVAVGTLANGALVTEVITKSNSTYSLYLDGKEVARGNDVAVGEYDIGVTVTADNYDFDYNYGTLTVTKADFKLSGIELKNAGYVYDGKPHAAEISGTLPEGVSVSYEYHLNGEKIDGVPTEKGLYTVYAKFTLADTHNYNDIPDKLAYLKIAATQAELDKGFPDEAPDPDGNNKDKGGETPDPNPNPNPAPDPSEELENKKNAAKDELDKAAQAKKDAIDADPNLTDEQKQAAKDKVDKELQAGKDAIDKATDESGVSSAESSAKTNIGNISIDPIGGNTEDGDSFPWWIIAVAAGVLLLLIALVIVIVKRRQVADGDEDFYDEDYDFDEEDFEEDFSDDDF